MSNQENTPPDELEVNVLLELMSRVVYFAGNCFLLVGDRIRRIGAIADDGGRVVATGAAFVLFMILPVFVTVRVLWPSAEPQAQQTAPSAVIYPPLVPAAAMATKTPVTIAELQALTKQTEALTARINRTTNEAETAADAQENVLEQIIDIADTEKELAEAESDDSESPKDKAQAIKEIRDELTEYRANLVKLKKRRDELRKKEAATVAKGGEVGK